MKVLCSMLSMVRFKIAVFLIYILFISSEEYVDKNCFNVENYFWKYLAAKTPYRYIVNHNISEITYGGCYPKKLWAVFRHGTRYPNSKFIKKMKLRLSEIQHLINLKNKSSLCRPFMDKIKFWMPSMDVKDGKKLSHEGEDEMIELAERFQTRFPSLLGVEYSNSSFNFRSTATARTKKSKYYFLIGLFGRHYLHNIWSPEPIFKDPILRFYKNCKKWMKDVHNNPYALIECEAFKTSTLAKSVVTEISKRLGFKENLLLEDIEIIYTTCRYESALYRNAPSPWCFVFTEKDMEVLEFLADLKHYWVDGYGYNINYRQACPLLKDMLHHLRSDDGPRSTLYFAHSGTLLKFLAHLGLYDDAIRLTHNSFMHPRLWRVGYIGAFGSNLVFVTFQCGDQLKLLTMHQERIISLPGCPREDLCPFHQFVTTYKESFENCQFEQICDL